MQGAARVAAFQACVSGALKQPEVGGGEAANLAFGPRIVGPFEWFAAPEGECRFECLRFAVGVARGEQPVELVEVDANAVAVEAVALAVADPGVCKCVAGVGDYLPEARSGVLGVLCWP